MTIHFPPDFFFGTSTSAYQIETAFEHDWKDVTALDGTRFDRTTDHEKKYESDAKIISDLATHYRMSLMWSKLQRNPYAPLDRDTASTYHNFIRLLRGRNTSLMMVLYHWVNPKWFAKAGGWTKRENIPMWTDFAKKVVNEFGDYIEYWNTFNEPNLFATLAYAIGEFPPYLKRIDLAIKVSRHMAEAHAELYRYIKEKYPERLVGISINTAVFAADNPAGILPSLLARRWYLSFLLQGFKDFDYTGISYYARITFDPLPVTNLYTPGKVRTRNLKHDDIWQYYPEGLGEMVRLFWNRFRKPIIVTENGICTSNDEQRVSALKDYAREIRAILDDGIPLLGYYHWTTWDNFEWTLGTKYQFGLYSCDPLTKERAPKASADVYRKLSHLKSIDIEHGAPKLH